MHDERFYHRALGHASVGVGESYMDGWWDVPQLDEFFYRIHRAELDKRVKTRELLWLGVRSALFNLQKKSCARNRSRASTTTSATISTA